MRKAWRLADVGGEAYGYRILLSYERKYEGRTGGLGMISFLIRTQDLN